MMARLKVTQIKSKISEKQWEIFTPAVL